MKVRLLVEGGGGRSGSKSADIACRRGFGRLLEKAGFTGSMPRVIPQGGRADALKSFRHAVDEPDQYKTLLLVDSEAPVRTKDPWRHLAQNPNDRWSKPASASPEQCHLMVQAMEAWFLADREALASYFGPGFAVAALPRHAELEEISTAELLRGLTQATRGTSKKAYSKGPHAFELLALIDPNKVRRRSPWAERFFTTLEALARG